MFLHTGWRSGGTWIWSRCREQPGAHALYEPLHEELGWLKATDISQLRPDSWASNHSKTAPYFQEYATLLRPGAGRGGGQGVRLHQRRFAFDRFFLEPNEEEPALEAYLASLLAAAPSQASVIKFCRSLGRVAWMERRFPGALHAVVLRDPASQWGSAETLLAETRNRYFCVAPTMVLASNARHPLVRHAAAALGVRLPALHSDNLSYVTETCWRALHRLDPVARYRLFLAFWTATALHALDSGAMLVEARRMVTDDAHRDGVQAALRLRVGPGLSLAPRDVAAGVRSPATAALQRRPPISDAERRAAHAAAAALALDWGGGLGAARLDVLLGHLGVPAPPTRPPRLAPPLAPLSPPPPRTWAERALTAVAVLAARALHGARHLHGALRRRVAHETVRKQSFFEKKDQKTFIHSR